MFHQLIRFHRAVHCDRPNRLLLGNKDGNRTIIRDPVDSRSQINDARIISADLQFSLLKRNVCIRSVERPFHNICDTTLKIIFGQYVKSKNCRLLSIHCIHLSRHFRLIVLERDFYSHGLRNNVIILTGRIFGSIGSDRKFRNVIRTHTEGLCEIDLSVLFYDLTAQRCAVLVCKADNVAGRLDSGFRLQDRPITVPGCTCFCKFVCIRKMNGIRLAVASQIQIRTCLDAQYNCFRAEQLTQFIQIPYPCPCRSAAQQLEVLQPVFVLQRQNVRNRNIVDLSEQFIHLKPVDGNRTGIIQRRRVCNGCKIIPL